MSGSASSSNPERDIGREPSADEVSLIRGGPFYRVQHATHVLPSDRWNLSGRIALAIGIGWLPLLLMTVVFHPSATRSLLWDYRVNARMLFAVPVLLIGQLVMESRFQMIVRHLRRSGILDVEGLTELDKIIAKGRRWRDSWW